MSEYPVLSGAEPWSAAGGPNGALVVHGFTGSPQSMRGLAEALAGAGFTVELPRLPGHGTAVEDMLTTGWADWSGHVEQTYRELVSRCDKVVVTGLSMGGTLTLWLAARHPEIAGIVPINGAAEPAAEMNELIGGMIDAGETTMPAIGGDIAKEGVEEVAYELTPLQGLLGLGQAIDELQPRLGSITMPALIINSVNDHVVAPTSSDHLAASLGGPVERLVLEDSFHVATLDHDAERINEATVAFARRVCS
jgi:carboxylesterase